jgi:hypothetical protein
MNGFENLSPSNYGFSGFTPVGNVVFEYSVLDTSNGQLTKRTTSYCKDRKSLLEALNEWNRTWNGKYVFWSD